MSSIVNLIDLEHPQIDFLTYILVTNLIDVSFGSFNVGFAHRYTFNMLRLVLQPYIGVRPSLMLQYGVRIYSTIHLLNIAYGAWDLGQTSVKLSERESVTPRPWIHPFIQTTLTCSIAGAGFSLALSSFSRLQAIHRKMPIIFAGLYIFCTTLSTIRPGLGIKFQDRVREWFSHTFRRDFLLPYQRRHLKQGLAISRSFLSSESQLSDYTYSSLNSRNMIRLLKIEPDRESHSRVVCDISL